MSTGHTEGDLEPLFVLLTDQALYLLRRGERLHRYITDTRIVYNDLDYISVSFKASKFLLGGGRVPKY